MEFYNSNSKYEFGHEPTLAKFWLKTEDTFSYF